MGFEGQQGKLFPPWILTKVRKGRSGRGLGGLVINLPSYGSESKSEWP